MSAVSLCASSSVLTLLLTLFTAAPADAHQRLAQSGKVADVLKSGTVTVIGKEFKFVPNMIRVKAGEHVTIVFKDEGRLSHNLTIPDLGAHTPTIQSGAQATLRFTAQKAGTYPFWCTVPGHKEAGMRGEVRVQ